MDIELGDMPNDDLLVVAEFCGIDTAVALMKNMGGLSIYIPKKSFHVYLSRILNQGEKFPDFKRLALELGVTERHIRKVWGSTKK